MKIIKVQLNVCLFIRRCVDAEAFEVNKDDLSNGIFMSFLKKRLMEQEKVTVMLDRVAEGSGLHLITFRISLFLNDLFFTPNCLV